MTSADSGPRPGALADATARRLDRSLVTGLAWTGGAKWATQILSWLSTLIVARLLTPADYGLVGMAMVYLGFVQLVNELGLGSAVIQRRGLTDDQVARLAGLSVLAGFGFFAVSAAAAWPIARFFAEPPVTAIIVVLSLTSVINGWQLIPKSLLTRDLQFRRVAGIEAAEAITLTATTLSLAVAGLGYWALVIGPVAAKLVGTVLTIIWRPQRLAWPRRFRSIAGEVAFGWHVVVSQVTWYLYTNADFAIVGRVLGKTSLGAYTIGWSLASIPVDRISAVVGRVTPAVLAAVQDDPPALRRYFAGLTETLGAITFPASIGLALVADHFVLVALGDGWRAAILPLRLLAFYAGFRSIATLYGQVMIATGRPHLLMQFNLVALLILPLMFYLGTTWGTAGVAAAWIVGYPIVTVPFFLRYVLRFTGLTVGGYLRALWPALSGTAVMAVAVLLTRALTDGALARPLALALDVGVGALAYLGFVAAAHRARVAAIRRVLRESRQRV